MNWPVQLYDLQTAGSRVIVEVDTVCFVGEGAYQRISDTLWIDAGRPQIPTLSVAGRSAEARDEEEMVKSLWGHLVDLRRSQIWEIVMKVAPEQRV